MTPLLQRLWPWTQKVLEQGSEQWNKTWTSTGMRIPNSEFERDFIVYEVTNRWTGSVTIKKVYLN